MLQGTQCPSEPGGLLQYAIAGIGQSAGLPQLVPLSHSFVALLQTKPGPIEEHSVGFSTQLFGLLIAGKSVSQLRSTHAATIQ
jgi:hypothetical protein